MHLEIKVELFTHDVVDGLEENGQMLLKNSERYEAMVEIDLNGTTRLVSLRALRAAVKGLKKAKENG
jgi:hypothetical protein